MCGGAVRTCCAALLVCVSGAAGAVGARGGGGGGVRVPGDVVVGGLFAVHGAPRAGGAGGGGCGAVREHYGIQRVEAALLALEQARPLLPPGLSLGAHLRDSCWAPHTALRQALALVRAPTAPTAHTAAGERCHTAQARRHRSDAMTTPRSGGGGGGGGGGGALLGVLGPGASSAAVQVQNLLQLFSVPQVSYSATSRELSDRARFRTFYRVVPSDLHQARVLLALLRAHNWTYVHALHTDESYGQSGMAVFREQAAAEGVCIAREEPLRAEPTAAETARVAARLAGPGPRVAVCWCEGRTARALLAGLARAGLRLRLLATDGWADRTDVVAGLEAAARGSLTVKIRSPHLAHFDRHYTALRPHDNHRNPWFQEFWEQKFNCSLSARPPRSARRCTGVESLSAGHTQEPKLSLVVRGVLALAHALRDMAAALCPAPAHAPCPNMLPFNLTVYQSYLSRVKFRAPDGGLVAFDENGDPPAELSEYDIMSLVRGGGGDGGAGGDGGVGGAGGWRYVRVGVWRGGRLRLESERATRARAAASRASCSPPCAPGHYQEAAGESGARCCWACVPCPPHSVPWTTHAPDHNRTAPSGCRLCPQGHSPDITKTFCEAAALEWGGPRGLRWAVGSVAACGLAGAAGSAVALWWHRDTPVVKAASRELCALLLAAAALCHAAALATLARPAAGWCELARLAGPALAAVYAAVLARTVRVARLVAAVERSPAKRPRLLSSAAQVWLWCALSAPGAGAALWAGAAWPSSPRVWHPARGRSVLRCGGAGAAQQLVPLAPALALLVACAALAVRTRRLPHNFNEARFIGAAVYTACLAWTAFLPVFAWTEARALSLGGCVSLSAGACVALCVWPRVYVCVWRPHRNTRSHFLTARSIRCHLGRYEPQHAPGEARAGAVAVRDACCQAGVAGAAGEVCARVTELHTGGDTRDILITLHALHQSHPSGDH